MKKSLLITGASGFIGLNLKDALKLHHEFNIYECSSKNKKEEILQMVARSDIIVHLAAVHRPINITEFMRINVDLTKEIVNTIKQNKNSSTLIFTSSIHVHGDSEFGYSKCMAEQLVKEIKNNYIIRLTNLFGPYGRPNGHSVVATFMYKVIKEEPLVINNGRVKLKYVGEVTDKIVGLITSEREKGKSILIEMEEGFEVEIKELADTIINFNECLKKGVDPNLKNTFERNLFDTFLWYKKNIHLFSQL